jgi:hypothetical protein
MFTIKRVNAAVACLVMLPACATSERPKDTASAHIIIGPKGYTVDWGLPETGDYWVPNETADDIKAASGACKASPSVFVYHHIPRPPQFSDFGLHFAADTDEQQRACVVARLKAVPSLTVYPKRK